MYVNLTKEFRPECCTLSYILSVTYKEKKKFFIFYHFIYIHSFCWQLFLHSTFFKTNLRNINKTKSAFPAVGKCFITTAGVNGEVWGSAFLQTSPPMIYSDRLFYWKKKKEMENIISALRSGSLLLRRGQRSGLNRTNEARGSTEEWLRRTQDVTGQARETHKEIDRER